jgi:hypothetical protein
MAVYRGVVKDNRIELDGDARLTDGARVDVYIRADATPTADADGEEAFLRRLRAEGVLDERPSYNGPDGYANPAATGATATDIAEAERALARDRPA